MLNEIIDLVARRRGYVGADELQKAVAEAAEKASASAAAQMDTQLLSAVTAALNFGVAPEKSYNDLVGAYRGWVYTAVDKIAKTGATLPLKLKVYRRKDGKKVLDPSGIRMKVKAINTAGERKYALKDMGLVEEEIYEHPFLDLMRRPNGIMSRMVLWYETILRMEVGGSCGWYVANNRLGLPGEIWPLPLTSTATLAPRVSTGVQIIDWIYQDGGVRKTFAPDDIVMFKYPNPKNPFLGFSPLMAQTYPYDIDLFLLQQQRSLFQNKGIPGIHLHTDSPMTKEQAKEIRDQVTEQWGSATQSGRPLVTHSGLKADKTGWSNKESEASEVGKDMRERLISSYDLSEGKLGLVADVNRANLDALNDTFILECMKPKCMLIEEQIEAFLLPRWDRGLFCDFDLPDTGDREADRMEEEMALRSFAITINEWRASKGKDPVAWGNRPWFTFGVTQDPDAIPPELSPPPAKGEEDEAEEKAASVVARARRWRRFIARQTPWEKMVTSQMKGYFENVGSEVIARLNKLGPRVEAQYSGWSRKAVQKHIAEKGVGDDININKKAEAARLKLLVKPPVTALVEEGGKRILREIGVDFAFNVNDPKVAKWLGSRMDMFSAEVAGTTFDDIRAVLRQGFSDGKPLSVIADTLRETFDSYEKYRAPLIARTETIAASNKADLLAIRQAGIEEKVVKTWLTAGDENVRPTHQRAGERYADGIPIGDMFQVGDDEMDAPGNGSDPAESINCFLPGTLVSGRFVAGLKARYSGPAREIKTAGGHRLSVTPNHPVLTSRGMVPAKDLRKGDALLGYHGESRFLLGVVGDADCKNGPPLIEYVFEAFAANGRMLETATDADLHGDARLVNGEIEIVTAKGMLTRNRKTSIAERAEDLILISADAGESEMVGLGACNLSRQRILVPPTALPCAGTLTLDQPTTLVDLGPFQPLRLGPAADWDVPLPKTKVDDVSIHAEFVRQLLDRCAGKITFDEVVDVLDFDFSGHVYDLQTDVGWMIAQGIVTSNCRCATGYEKA